MMAEWDGPVASTSQYRRPSYIYESEQWGVFEERGEHEEAGHLIAAATGQWRTGQLSPEF